MTIPIKKIVLYSNGFTSFEREGEVAKTETINTTELYFKAQDLEEVLKSLSCSTSDSKNSTVCSISYENTKRDNEDMSINISSDQSFSSLLTSLKGTQVEVTVDQQKIQGTLLGIEEFAKENSDPVKFINLFTDGSMVQSIELLKMDNIKFLDYNVQNSIQHSLENYLSQKHKDLLKVSIFSQGSKPYHIQASYSLQSKEWIPSYRLQIIDDKNAKLGVFAALENTQDEDWKDIELTLVSGAPTVTNSKTTAKSSTGSISLNIKCPNNSSFCVRANSSDIVLTVKKKIQDVNPQFNAKSVSLVFAGKRLEDGRTLHDYNIKDGSNLHISKSEVENESAGSSENSMVFRLADPDNLSYYKVHTPVTVKRNQSALIPILDSKVEITKVLIFDRKIRAGNPMSGLMFMNTTGYTLEGGTIVLKQNKQTIGESILEQMWYKDETMIPYALELGVEVSMDVNTHYEKPHHIVLKNEEVKIFSYKTNTTKYSFHNKTNNNFGSLYLNHYFLDGWDLQNKDEPVDITDSFYKFLFPVPASKEKQVFSVEEKAIHIETASLSHVNNETIEKWVQKGILRPNVQQELTSLIELEKASNLIYKKISELEAEIRECRSRQDQWRKNIEVLRDAKQQTKYVNELSAEDDRVKGLYKEIRELTAEKQEVAKKTSTKRKSMFFEYDLKYD